MSRIAGGAAVDNHCYWKRMIDMRAKAKTAAFAALVLLCAGAGAAKAGEAPTVDRCEQMAAIDPDKLSRALINYAGRVLGKQPEHWSDQDYKNLYANAVSCNGLPAGAAKPVNAEMWRVKLSDAEQQNRPINAASLAIAAAYGGYWNAADGEFPACATFLRWKRDDVWFTNNSADLFGTAFSAMEPKKLAFFRRIVEECRPVMGKILTRWHLNESTAGPIVASVQDSMAKDAQAGIEKDNPLPLSLVIYHGGQKVPVAYLRKTTQDIVRRIAMLENANRVMPTTVLISISKWAEEMERRERDGPDVAYARLIKSVIAQHMFANANNVKDLGAASANPALRGP
jgi:hypothetical protein